MRNLTNVDKLRSVWNRTSQNSFSDCLRRIQKPWLEDMALQWRRSNEGVAKACLEPPRNDPSRDSTPNLSSWSEYWKWRQWDFTPSRSTGGTGYAQALATHLLSAPLTVATLLLRAATNYPEVMKDNIALHCCCIGARSESMIPAVYWREALLVWQHTIVTRPFHVQLSFVGPDIRPRPSVTMSAGEDLSMELCWAYKGLFHDFIQKDDLREMLDYDAFIFLNPGFGHPHMNREWKPTLDILFHPRTKTQVGNDLAAAKSSVVLTTAHSMLDSKRDWQCLKLYANSFRSISDDQTREHDPTSFDYQYDKNTFSSTISYHDPFDMNHIVRPNQYHKVLLVPRVHFQ